jgi:uncharacterized protein YydD (DUF2326 family)
VVENNIIKTHLVMVILDELELTLNKYSLLKEQLDFIEDKIYELNKKLY